MAVIDVKTVFLCLQALTYPLGDVVVDVVQLLHLQRIGTAVCDVDDEVPGSFHVEVLKKGGGECAFHCLEGSVLSVCDARANQGHAAVAHHCLHVLQVHVLVSGLGDDLVDAAYSRVQHVVGFLKG